MGLGAGSRAQERAGGHWCTTPSRWALSRVAATQFRPYCLYAARSKAGIPGVTCMLFSKCWGRDHPSRTLMDRLIRVAVLRCRRMGMKATAAVFSGRFT